MKRERHGKIIELIGRYDIETQEELAEKLNEAGFQVTQATVSRDIRELKLTKMTMGDRQRYVAVREHSRQMGEKYIGILRDGFVSMDVAQNILVIKTVSGMAMAVAAALDALHWQDIVGCIAGDDTVFCAIRTAEDTLQVMDKLRKMMKEL
ncbi:MAG: arginine repressor [Lachnospiraceae bacterium]|jgi:transcriptional regulator of arginine metabolism|nr:arginine repressor [Lachnospiraceae bacterium]MCI9252645.1 arginine repressor [Lachnospiraceae bacterium]MCI9383816.1 arginine repressor [Lachnospiraceae bacterium]MCI9622344.1 arginine repressor [Lachnospiraceae bacterium]GFI08772.1 arginine repressor [Lachnospiraceae bacterium]